MNLQPHQLNNQPYYPTDQVKLRDLSPGLAWFLRSGIDAAKRAAGNDACLCAAVDHVDDALGPYCWLPFDTDATVNQAALGIAAVLLGQSMGSRVPTKLVASVLGKPTSRPLVVLLDAIERYHGAAWWVRHPGGFDKDLFMAALRAADRSVPRAHGRPRRRVARRWRQQQLAGRMS